MNLRQVQKLAATKTFSDMNGQHNGAKLLLKGAQSQKEPKEIDRDLALIVLVT